MSVLDLSGADAGGFEAIPSGTYDCVVQEAEWQETKGGQDAKLPAGTPRLNVQFKVIQEFAKDGTKVLNRRLFNGYTIPPADYDVEKSARMKGMMVNFLKAVGYDEKQITSGKFKLDVTDLTGRECRVVVGQKPKYNGEPGEMDNEVRGVKPVGSANVEASAIL